jgi:hypothetical protein
MHGQLQTRSWNGTAIPRRTSDGYVNATAMCKANGKRWSDYRESDRCQQYIDALESETGISGFDLIQSTRGGTGSLTMVHPQVAIDLARWISAPFAVWMDGWFLEKTAPQPLPATPEQQNLEWLMKFAGSYGIAFDDRDQLQIKNYAMQLALPAAGGVTGVYTDIPISRGVMELFNVVLSNEQLSKIGRYLARSWRVEFACEPAKHDQYVDGANRSTFHYPKEWIYDELKGLYKEQPQLFAKENKARLR